MRTGQRWGQWASLRAFGALVLVPTLALGAAGCGIADKRNQAEILRAASTELAEARTAEMALAQRLVIVKAPEAGQVGSTSARKAGFATPRVTTTVELDYPRRITATRPPSDAVVEPVQYFREGAFYLRRVNARPGSRAWLKFDFAPHFEDRKAKRHEAYGAGLFNPVWLVDLTRGALTGSVERVGTAEIRGVAVTHYRANFDWEKALKELSQESRETIETALEMMGVPSRVVKGAMWMSADGLPVRIDANIRQQRDRHRVVEWQFSLEFTAVGQPLSIELPLTRDISVVNTVASLGVAVATDVPGPTP